jgi:hypothetical protein
MIETERVVKEDGSFVETSTQEQSSVVIKKTSKGDITWEMKVYNDDPNSFEDTASIFLGKIADVIDKAKRLNL